MDKTFLCVVLGAFYGLLLVCLAHWPLDSQPLWAIPVCAGLGLVCRGVWFVVDVVKTWIKPIG